MKPSDRSSLENQIRWHGPESLGRASNCPADAALAAFLDGRLSAADRASVEEHLSQCGSCLALVGTVTRARRPRSRKLSPLRRPLGRRVIGAAAAVTLTVSVLLSLRVPEELSGPVDTAPNLRYSHPSPLTPEVSFPAGNEVALADLEVAWTDVPDRLFYELRIVADDGDLIWTQRLTESKWHAPAELELSGGARYFVRVDAYLPDGKPLKSRHASFRVSAGSGQ